LYSNATGNFKVKNGLKKCAKFADNTQKCCAVFASDVHRIFIFWRISVPFSAYSVGLAAGMASSL